MAKALKYLFTLGLPLVLAGVGATWMLAPSLTSEKGVVYETVPAAKGTIRKVVSTSGPVRALVTVSVGSQISGQVDKVTVDFNSEVKEGDVLATIDPRTFEARVAQAKADIATAEATLVNQQAALSKAEAVKANAERALERQTSLEQKGFASTAVLDAARRDADVANADIAVSKAQIESAKAGISQKKAALLQSQIDLERTEIVSPVNGTVISRTVDPGQTVAASLQAPELFKIAQDLKRIRIEAQVNEADVGTVAQGNPAQFTVDAYPDRTFHGKVTQVRLSATELNNVVTYTVIIEASNEDRKLFPGMTANVQIEVAKVDDALRVPNDALRYRPRNGADGEASRGGAESRGARQIARLKNELELTEAQEARVREEITKVFASNAGGDGTVDREAVRQKLQTAIEQALIPLLTEEQRPLFEQWKRGRENVRSGSVYILDKAGAPDRTYVRLGISDDQYTEIVGGQLKVGDAVIVRARDKSK